jgi:hypothetical protein
MSKFLPGAMIAAGLALAAQMPAFALDIDVSAAQQARAELQAAMSAQTPATAIPGDADPSEIFVNPYRAYPPSCLNAPLGSGLWQRDPNVQQKTMTLSGDPLSADAAERSYTETVTVSVSRLACSGGKSALLMEIDRPTGASTTLYPVYPGVRVTQGTKQNVAVRTAADPNTFLSHTDAQMPLTNSGTFVFEAFYPDANAVDYNQALTITLDNFIASSATRYTTFTLAAYNAAQYPEASSALPINGYMSSNWANPNQTGEGIVVQVYDDRDSATRTLSITWFTYDDAGAPFWLYGQTTLPIGANLISAPMAYYSTGKFAGPASSPSVPHTSWGLATITFPDCAHMKVNYNGDASALHGPKGQGSITFVRVADVNGLVCQ